MFDSCPLLLVQNFGGLEIEGVVSDSSSISLHVPYLIENSFLGFIHYSALTPPCFGVRRFTEHKRWLKSSNY